MDKKHCVGCYNDDYNHGLGGAEECWFFKDAKLVKKKKVGMNDVPPWNHKPIRVPNCYRQTGYWFVNADRTC